MINKFLTCNINQVVSLIYMFADLKKESGTETLTRSTCLGGKNYTPQVDELVRASSVELKQLTETYKGLVTVYADTYCRPFQEPKLYASKFEIDDKKHCMNSFNFEHF